MEKWEYCSVVVRESGSIFVKYWARVAYYSPDGNIRVEELKTDIKQGPDGFRDAIGYALAYLGQQGWELAVKHSESGAFLLKRPVTTT
jgi:hypothetical protein